MANTIDPLSYVNPNTDRINITKMAWDMARQAAAQYGGKAKDYFGSAMKVSQQQGWRYAGGKQLENILEYLDVSVSSSMQRYVENARQVLLSLLLNAVNDAEERGEEQPEYWVLDKLQEYFGGAVSEIEERMKIIELAIYDGSGFSRSEYKNPEEGFIRFKRQIAELEKLLQTTANGKWW